MSELENLKSMLRGGNAPFNRMCLEAIEGLESRLDSAETQIGKLHDLLHDKNDEIVSLSGKVSQYETANDYFKERIVSVAEERDECSGRLNDLSSRLDSIRRYCEDEVSRDTGVIMRLLDGAVEKRQPVRYRYDPLTGKEYEPKMSEDWWANYRSAVERQTTNDCGARHVDGMTRVHECTLPRGHDGWHGRGLFAWPPQ